MSKMCPNCGTTYCAICATVNGVCENCGHQLCPVVIKKDAPNHKNGAILTDVDLVDGKNGTQEENSSENLQ